ncbi:MAG TPA: hypothetical protein VHY37_03410 [Tepidisphaeraceae bacterium]|jgi:hypothetical protein|nr:hypothetical protein [Tepidisphaeraceae bacterium]
METLQDNIVGSAQVARMPNEYERGAWARMRRVAWAVCWKNPTLTAVVLSVVCLLVFLAPRGWWNTGTSGDTAPAELLPIAILKYHALDFDRLIAEHPSVANRNDLPYWFTERNGRVVSFYPIVPGLMNVPTYSIAGWLGYDLFHYRYILSHITSCVIGALSAGFMFLALDAICERRVVAITFTIVFAFGTEVWGTLTEGMWQHGPSILLLSAAMMILLRRWRWGIPLAGVLLGLAVWNRPTNVLLVAPIALYAAFAYRRQVAAFACAMGVPLMLLAIYSYLYCGSVVYLGQGRSAVEDLSSANKALTAPLPPGVTGALRGPLGAGVAGLLFSPNRGLFVFAPIFAAGFAYLIYATFSLRENSIFRCMLAGILLSLWCYGHWFVWWGGWSWGYRLLSEWIPFLILASAMSWQRWLSRYRLTRWPFIAVGLWMIYVQTLGALYFRWNDFNFRPDNIDKNPARIWTIQGGEIARDQKLLWADLKTICSGHLPKMQTPKPIGSNVK